MVPALLLHSQDAQGNGAAPGPALNGHITKRAHTADVATEDDDADWRDRLFSVEGRAREMCALRELLAEFAHVPGIIGLHGGLPPAESFPFRRMSFELRDGRKITVDDPQKMFAAQQYCVTPQGYPPLYDWVRRHTWRLHAPPGDHACMVTSGSNQTIEMVLRLVLERGDTLLCEDFTYPHVYESMCLPLGINTAPLPMDDAGIVPSALREALHVGQGLGQRRPRLLYTVPTGQNPTGTVASSERKRELYALCCMYDVLILEDDPYFYLQYPPESGGPPQGTNDLGHSFLSLDVQQRVIRLDSFAKMLAPGLRLGWVTAPRRILLKLQYHVSGITLGPCSLSQVAIAELLEAWGDAGFEAHVQQIQQLYGQRAAVVHAAAQEHLAGLAEWAAPRAGMFLWLRLAGPVLSADEIMAALKLEKVVVVPGRYCSCEGLRPGQPCPFVRISFASAPLGDLRAGMARLGRVLRAVRAAGGVPQAVQGP